LLLITLFSKCSVYAGHKGGFNYVGKKWDQSLLIKEVRYYPEPVNIEIEKKGGELLSTLVISWYNAKTQTKPWHFKLNIMWSHV
jgi:hypothetical protein